MRMWEIKCFICYYMLVISFNLIHILLLLLQFFIFWPALTFLSILTLILPRSRTGTVWFYTSTSNKRAARQKLYTVINKGLKTYV
jgi:hypothetical protein